MSKKDSISVELSEEDLVTILRGLDCLKTVTERFSPSYPKFTYLSNKLYDFYINTFFVD